MGRKRRQRSTAIRKRIEKKQREEAKRNRRAAKAAGREHDVMMTTTVSREGAEGTCKAVLDLEGRLEAAPIRGWTTDDLSGDHGLSWFSAYLGELLESQDEDPITVEFSAGAKRILLDRLGPLEVAAPGLELDWESGLAEVTRALVHAQEIPDEDEEEDAA